MRTGNILLLYLAVAVMLSLTEATEEFHKRTGNACMFCHRSSSGGSPGRPNLRPEGISFIKGLIEEEAYVPTNRIRQLNLLVDKIAENKALRDGTASAAEPTAELEASQPATEIVSESSSEDAVPVETGAVAIKTAGNIVSSEAEVSVRPVENLSGSVGAATAVTGVLIPVSPASELVEPGVRIKGSKTFILKRDRSPEIPRSYLAGEDWEYDDYF